MEITRAGVVTEPSPTFEDVFAVRSREGFDVGESFKKSFVVGNHGFDAGLLQHRFGNPDRIRVARLSPRQVSMSGVVPGKQGLA